MPPCWAFFFVAKLLEIAKQNRCYDPISYHTVDLESSPLSIVFVWHFHELADLFYCFNESLSRINNANCWKVKKKLKYHFINHNIKHWLIFAKQAFIFNVIIWTRCGKRTILKPFCNKSQQFLMNFQLIRQSWSHFQIRRTLFIFHFQELTIGQFGAASFWCFGGSCAREIGRKEDSKCWSTYALMDPKKKCAVSFRVHVLDWKLLVTTFNYITIKFVEIKQRAQHTHTQQKSSKQQNKTKEKKHRTRTFL